MQEMQKLKKNTRKMKRKAKKKLVFSLISLPTAKELASHIFLLS